MFFFGSAGRAEPLKFWGSSFGDGPAGASVTSGRSADINNYTLLHADEARHRIGRQVPMGAVCAARRGVCVMRSTFK